MARIPTASQLGAPSFGGGRAVRQIPNAVQLPDVDVPVPNLPSGVNVPTVNIQAPDVPNSVPIANEYNIGNIQVPDTLYTAGQIDALGAPGRAFQNLGRTVSSEADRWLTQLNALELERANIAKTQGFAQIAKELDEDKDYKTWLPRYQAAAEKVRKDALGNITMPNHAERWARDFDERVANDLEGLRKKAYRAEADDGRKELGKIIDTRKAQLQDKWASDVDKAQARKDVDEAIAKMESLGYISKDDAEIKRKAFAQDVALTTASSKIAEGKSEEVLQDIAGGKGLYNLERAPTEVQQAAVKAAEETGLPIQYIAEMANARGGFDPEKPGVGIFKMGDDEWVNAFDQWAAAAPREPGATAKTRAEQYGLSQLAQNDPAAYRAAVLNMRNDPVLEMMVGAEGMQMAAALVNDNMQGIEGVPADYMATPKDIFLFQSLGEQQAMELLATAATNPRMKVGDLWEQETIDALGLDRNDTMKQAYDWLTKDVSDGKLPSAYTDLDQATKLSLRNKADTALYKSRTEANRQTRLNKINVQELMKSSVKEMAENGKIRPGQEPDPQEIVKLLGEDKALEYARDMDASQAIYDLTDDIPNLPSDAVAAIYDNLTPDDFPDMDYTRFTRIKQEFKKKKDEVLKLRKKDPAAAVADSDQVLSVIDNFNELEASQPEGVMPGEDLNYIKQRKLAEARMEAQKELGLRQVPITNEEADLFARRLREGDNSRDSLVATVNDVETIYGKEMGKRVMTAVIERHYKRGKEKDTAERIIAKVANGDPLDFESIQRDIIQPQIDAMPDNLSEKFLSSSSIGKEMDPRLINTPKSFPKPPPAAVDRVKAEPHLADKFAAKYGIDALLQIFKSMPKAVTPVLPVN